MGVSLTVVSPSLDCFSLPSVTSIPTDAIRFHANFFAKVSDRRVISDCVMRLLLGSKIVCGLHVRRLIEQIELTHSV